MSALANVLTAATVDPVAYGKQRIRELFRQFACTLEGGREDKAPAAYREIQEALKAYRTRWPRAGSPITDYQAVVLTAFAYGMIAGGLEAEELEVNYG